MSNTIVPPDDENAATLTRAHEDGPWGVKWVAGLDKTAALAAAKRARRPVGEWLGEAIREKVEAEREDRSSFDVLAPGSGLTTVEQFPNPALSLREVAALVEIVGRMAAIEGKPANARLLAGARRVLAMRLRGALTP